MNMGESDYKKVFKMLIIRCMIAIVALMMLLISRQAVVQIQMINADAPGVMRISGRQCTLSQIIVKDVLILEHAKSTEEKADCIKRIRSTVEEWQESHYNLANDKIDKENNGQGNRNSAVINEKYAELEPHFYSMYEAIEEILQLASKENLDEEKFRSEAEKLQLHEQEYFDGMLWITEEYYKDAKQLLIKTRDLEIAFFIIIIFTTIMITVFVFIPVYHTLNNLFMDLSERSDNLIKMFHAMHGAMFLIKPEGDIFLINSDGEKMIIPEGSSQGGYNLIRDIKWVSINIQTVMDRLEKEERVDDIQGEIEDREGNQRTILLYAIRGFYQREKAAMVSFYDITIQKRAEDALKNLVMRDELTGLYNRHFLNRIIENEMQRAQRYEIPLSVYIMDLDHFKRVNDKWGHPVGDTVLKMASDVLLGCTRMSDYVIRIGGEEFVVLMPYTNLEGARQAAEKVRLELEARVHPIIGRITASFGVAERKRDEDYHDLYKRMDDALYQAKESGRNRVVCSDTEGEGGTAFILNWNNNWNSGEKKIDEQHRELFRLTSKFMGNSLLPTDKKMAVAQLDRILEHVKEHFEYEEEILKKAGYEAVSSHAALHKHLLERGTEIRNSVANDNADFSTAIIFLFDEIIVGHLLRDDIEYFSHIKDI